MRDFIGQELKVGDVCVILGNFYIKAKILRFTNKMVVVEKFNKTSTTNAYYPIELLNIEACYDKFPELAL